MRTNEDHVLSRVAAQVLRPLVAAAEVVHGQKPKQVAANLELLKEEDTGYGTLVNCSVNVSGKLVVVVSPRLGKAMETVECTVNELLLDCSTVF